LGPVFDIADTARVECHEHMKKQELSMKFVADRPFADPGAARKLLELANAVEPVQDGRIYREDQRAVHL
jgi:hypothetical protein